MSTRADQDRSGGGKRERTRAALVAATLAVVAERGFAGASLDEIAARAGMTKGAVYSNFGSNITNEARFQYSRDNEFETTQPPAPGEPTTGPGGSVPDVSVGNVFDFGKPTFLNRKALPDERRFQWADTASLTMGRHLFRFGMDINRVHDISDNLRFESGSYSYDNLQDFLTDFSKAKGCGGAPCSGVSRACVVVIFGVESAG